MMPIEGGAERRLTHDGGAINPAWSPDGAQIAYVVVREGRPCEIRLAPAAGGLSRRLTSCPTTETTSLTWARDGSALYFDDAMSAGAPRRLLRLTLRTGSVTPVTRPASGAGDMLAAVSPDGRRIAFLREQGWLTGDVMLLDLATQAIRRLEAAPSDVRGIAWSPDGASLIVSSTWGGDTGLWRLGLEGQPPVRLAGAGGMVGRFRRKRAAGIRGPLAGARPDRAGRQIDRGCRRRSRARHRHRSRRAGQRRRDRLRVPAQRRPSVVARRTRCCAAPSDPGRHPLHGRCALGA